MLPPRPLEMLAAPPRRGKLIGQAGLGIHFRANHLSPGGGAS